MFFFSSAHSIVFYLLSTFPRTFLQVKFVSLSLALSISCSAQFSGLAIRQRLGLQLFFTFLDESPFSVLE